MTNGANVGTALHAEAEGHRALNSCAAFSPCVRPSHHSTMAPPRKRGRLGQAYQRFNEFNVVSLFQRAPPPKTSRTIYVHQDLPDDFYTVKKKGKRILDKEHIYATNQVVTSKYTVFTFLPRNLLEQFRRIANMYAQPGFFRSPKTIWLIILYSFFLAIDILQFFPKFSTISPGLVILPLLAILFLTAAKDGYEDVKRHQSDRAVNHSEVDVLEGGDYTNPNVMGPKAKTFTPGIPRPLRRKKGVKGAGEPAADATDEIRAAEEKERAGGGPIDTEHAMRVQLPPMTNDGTVPGGSYPNSAPSSPGILRQPTRRLARRPDGQVGLAENPLGEDYGDDNEPHWAITLWEDLKVGDFVRLRSNQQIPADIVLCATSEPENVAFVETKNLDGETNLKSRNAVSELTHLTSAHAIVENQDGGARFRINAEAPDTNMYKFNAAVVFQDQDGKERVHPIDIQTTLLRGTILRNTDWAIGIVVYTGSDSKIVLNSGNTPSKRSRVERQMNPMV